jgi:intracellular sulfur oxidation DsrE/DsrF family protein
MKTPEKSRRRLLQLAALFGAGAVTAQARAHHTETHFEDESTHKVVYQCNKADVEYIDHILFSVGEMLRLYGDDIELIVAAFGPGLHLLGIRPGGGIKPMQQTRVKSLAEYGVAFHACGNTMKSLNWTEADLLDFAKVVPVGVDDLMQLQERGFSYISW